MHQNRGKMHLMRGIYIEMHQNQGENASKSRGKCIRLRVKIDHNEGKMQQIEGKNQTI